MFSVLSDLWNFFHKCPAYEPQHEKMGLLGFWPGLTQTSLYSQRNRLKAWNFGFRKKRNCIIRVAKTKALISFAATAKLICAFVFAYTKCWFSNDAAHILFFCDIAFCFQNWTVAWENQQFAYAKTKAQISCAVTAKLSAPLFLLHG